MSPIQSERSIQVFISYAHADQALRTKLEEHLSPLIHSRAISIWQDREIPPGENWENQINIHLNEADLILLLVSSSFLASKYCWNKEVQEALERHKAGTVRVIPIILKPVYWQDTPLGQLEALPTKAKPVTQWDDQDAAFEDVVKGIRKMVNELHSQQIRLSSSLIHRKEKDESILPTDNGTPSSASSGTSAPMAVTLRPITTSHLLGKRIMIAVCIAILLISTFASIKFIFSGKPVQRGTRTPTQPSLHAPTASSTSLLTEASTPPTPNTIAYDFEGSETGWDSDTQAYNPKLTIATDQAYTGHQSLKVTTQFIGDATPAYQQLDQNAKRLYAQTDAKVYFTQEPPAGFLGNEPFNFQGKPISCAVFLPQWLLSGGDGKMQIQLFAKNRFSGGFEPNAYSKPLLITHSNVQRWIQLTFTVGNEPGGQVDQRFDPTQVQAIGVLLTVLDGSTIHQKGSFYIDDCVLPH